MSFFRLNDHTLSKVDMIKVERFVFNAFQENTYVIRDEGGECIIVDAGCYEEDERRSLKDFIDRNALKPVAQVYTHCHIDHILGMTWVYETWNLQPLMHEASVAVLRSTPAQGEIFGVDDVEVVEPETFIKEGDEIKFGQASLEVLYTPGHVDGHICLVNREQKFVMSGDVLFRDSIGRTDLPTGDFNLLASSIRNKLFTLGDDYRVFPGHGPDTTIGYEILNNPFVKI